MFFFLILWAITEAVAPYLFAQHFMFALHSLWSALLIVVLLMDSSLELRMSAAPPESPCLLCSLIFTCLFTYKPLRPSQSCADNENNLYTVGLYLLIR